MNPTLAYYLIEQACKRLEGGSVFHTVSLTRHGITETELIHIIGGRKLSYSFEGDAIRLGVWDHLWTAAEKHVAAFIAIHFKAGAGVSVGEVQAAYRKWTGGHDYEEFAKDVLDAAFAKFGLIFAHQTNGYPGISFRED